MEPILLSGVSASRGVPRQAEVSGEGDTVTVRVRLAGATQHSIAASVSRPSLAERLIQLDAGQVRLPAVTGANDLMVASADGPGVWLWVREAGADGGGADIVVNGHELAGAL
jgi:hypothetical protein